jgi:acetyltransferase-like isoleucine patch superfamily enzyme
MTAIRRFLRFRWWAFVTGVRLRRLGGRLVLEAAGTPRMRGSLRVETGAHPGRVTLRLGRGVTIGRDCVIELADHENGIVELGDGTVLHSWIRMQPWGGAIRVGAVSQIRDGCELKSKGELRIGGHVLCGRNTTLHCHDAITLGDCVALGPGVSITDSDHTNDGTDTWFMDQPVLADAVVLERNVLCGTNAVVLRGTRILRNAVVAAGAVVAGGEHPEGWLIGGIPAKPIKPLRQAERDDPSLPLR